MGGPVDPPRDSCSLTGRRTRLRDFDKPFVVDDGPVVSYGDAEEKREDAEEKTSVLCIFPRLRARDFMGVCARSRPSVISKEAPHRTIGSRQILRAD
jgi:hypothetical protein